MTFTLNWGLSCELELSEASPMARFSITRYEEKLKKAIAEANLHTLATCIPKPRARPVHLILSTRARSFKTKSFLSLSSVPRALKHGLHTCSLSARNLHASAGNCAYTNSFKIDSWLSWRLFTLLLSIVATVLAQITQYPPHPPFPPNKTRHFQSHACQLICRKPQQIIKFQFGTKTLHM